MLALDISNYGGYLSIETVAVWKAAGVTRVIVGLDLGHVALAQQQLGAILQGGLEVGIYRFCYWGTDPATSWRHVAEAVEGFPLVCVWPDFEDVDAPEDNPAHVCTWIQDNLDAAASHWGWSIFHGLYTGAWWWVPFTGNSEEFSEWDLWVADYDYQPDLYFTAFGGWVPPAAMKQYEGSTTFEDYSVDLNWYEEDDVDEEARKLIAIQALANRWAAMIHLGKLQQVLNEAKALGAVAQ